MFLTKMVTLKKAGYLNMMRQAIGLHIGIVVNHLHFL